MTDYKAKRDLAAEANKVRLKEWQDQFLTPKEEYHGVDSWQPLSARQQAYREGAWMAFRDGADWSARYILESAEVKALVEALEKMAIPTVKEALTQFEAFKKSVEGGG